MASLAQRLGAATRSVQGAPAASVLPYECVRDYLEAHPLVAHRPVDARAVHAALVALDARAQAPVQGPAPRRAADCVECGAGYVVLDAAGGQHVCSACGLVQTRRTGNVAPEYVAPAPFVPRKRARDDGADALPGYLFLRARDPEYVALDELTELNAWVHLPDDDVRACARTFTAWEGSGHTRLAKMVACLLHPLLRAQFPSESDVRARVRQRASLPCVADPTPSPTFPCARCGALHYSKKEARFHCR